MKAGYKPMLAVTRPVVTVMIALAVFFSGGAVGNLLANWLAPGSGLSELISFLALPGAFMLSLVLWQGFTAAVLLVKLLWHRRRPSADSAALEALGRKAWLLVPLPILFATTAGIVAGIGGAYGFFTTIGVYALTGCVYGLVCYALGRNGMLPMLED